MLLSLASADSTASGRTMAITVELTERGAGVATLKGKGEADGQQTVSAKIVLASYRLAERDASLAETDERILRDLKARG